MLVLRLLLMVLTIICLMDGHAEVSSSTTGMRNGRDSPAVKPNETEDQSLDRKKKPKKPKKPKKTSKKKGKKPKPKPKPTKPVTTTPLTPTSTLKTTTTTTTETTTPTSTPTTTETITSTATMTTTTATLTTTEASTPTASTITTKTMTTTATTSSPPTTAATTADSGAGGECQATNGKPCIFPFKDGNEEYNECKNEGGKYFWCATSVYDSGKYKHWSYCPEDRSCPLEGDGECRATNNKPCVFPFKDGKIEYNECADHGGQYFWCATGTNSAGKYTAWSECPRDGSCPLPPKTTTPVMTPTATAATTTLLIIGTSTAPDEIENKVVTSLKDLVKQESKDGTLEMLEAMNKITQTIIEDLKGQSEDNDLKKIESNHTFEGGNPLSEELSLQYKQGVHFQETRLYYPNYVWFPDYIVELGTYYYVSKVSDCCWGCQLVSHDALFFDYDSQLQKCYCLAKRSNKEPAIWKNNRYTAGKCGIITCNLPLTPPNKDTCPPGYDNNIDGFPQEPDNSQVISRESINSKEKCKDACDDKQENCLGFYFNTCDQGNKPDRCLLLNVDKVDVTLNKNNNVFCKREPQGTFEECQCSDEEYPCNRCLISGHCQNPKFDCKEEEICYIEKNQNHDGYIPCGLSVAIKAIAFCENYKQESRISLKGEGDRKRKRMNANSEKHGRKKIKGRTDIQTKGASVSIDAEEEQVLESEEGVCSFNIEELNFPQIAVVKNNDFEDVGQIIPSRPLVNVDHGTIIKISCPGRKLRHSSLYGNSEVFAKCDAKAQKLMIMTEFEIWLGINFEFTDIACDNCPPGFEHVDPPFDVVREVLAQFFFESFEYCRDICDICELCEAFQYTLNEGRCDIFGALSGSNVISYGGILCRIQKSKKCNEQQFRATGKYLYHYKLVDNNKAMWSLFWNNAKRIPHSSIFHVKSWDKKSSEGSDGSLRFIEPTNNYVETVGPTMTNNKPLCLPVHNDYKDMPGVADCTSQSKDRGHLLSAQMIKTFILPKTKASQKHELTRLIIDIFPQQSRCNQHGDWKLSENKIMEMAETCMKTANQNFFLAHVVIPSNNNEINEKINIPSHIFVSSCCQHNTDSTKNVVVHYWIDNPDTITLNPFKRTNCEGFKKECLKNDFTCWNKMHNNINTNPFDGQHIETDGCITSMGF